MMDTINRRFMWTDHREGTPIHEWLGKRIDPQEQLDAEANARVLDESYAHDPDVQIIHNTSEDPKQWCPEGLPRSQKRRLQRMRDCECQENALLTFLNVATRFCVLGNGARNDC